MKPKEISLENMSFDYQFLRDNRVHAKTALKILGLAYMGGKKT